MSFCPLFLSPAEASRAVRKKLKHGNSHQQYRALVVSSLTLGEAFSPYPSLTNPVPLQILNALVENGDTKLKSMSSSHFLSPPVLLEIRFDFPTPRVPYQARFGLSDAITS